MLMPILLTLLVVLLADGIAKMSLVLYNHQLLICIKWQILLPSGRWNSHCRIGVLADVSAMWQME